MKKSFLLNAGAWVAILSTALLPKLSMASATFGFSNEAGNRIIALENIEHPQNIVWAICDKKMIPVHYSGTQKGNDKFNGRDKAYQFQKRPGQVYNIVNSTTTGDASCLLASADFMLEREIINIQALSSAETSDELPICSARQADIISSAKNRTVKNCWKLASLPTAGIYVVEFEMTGKSALASLVLLPHQLQTSEQPISLYKTHSPTSTISFDITSTAVIGDGEQPVFNDYPAEQVDETSVWRVDDEGTFCPQCFTILFAFKNSGQTEIGVDWGAFEGSSLELIQTDGLIFKELITGYRYTSPI